MVKNKREFLKPANEEKEAFIKGKYFAILRFTSESIKPDASTIVTTVIPHSFLDIQLKKSSKRAIETLCNSVRNDEKSKTFIGVYDKKFIVNSGIKLSCGAPPLADKRAD